MKLSELFEAVKTTSADEYARYEKFKRMLELGNPGVTQKMVDGIKKSADELLTSEMNAQQAKFAARAQTFINVHGDDWWAMAMKQYPIKQEGNKWVVRSNFAIDPDAGKRGPWEFDSAEAANQKVFQLVKWLADSRDRQGHGDRDKDAQKWLDRLDSVDLKKKKLVK